MSTIKIERIINRGKEHFRVPYKSDVTDYHWPDPAALCCDGMRRAFGWDGRFDYQSMVLDLNTWTGKIGPKMPMANDNVFDFCPYCGQRLEYEVIRTVEVVTKRVKSYREEREEVVRE